MDSIENTKTTILIVDDNPSNIKLLMYMLKEYGYNLLIAENGEDAIDQVYFAEPDIILLDVMLPGINGFETCRRLKQNEATKDIPIIFMTALASTDDKLVGFEVGGVDYITKPIQHKEMLARINTHITVRVLQRQLKEKNELLQRNTDDLKALNKTKDKFLSIIAHDLRNPFTTLIGLSDLLIKAYDKMETSKVQRLHQSILDSSKHAHQLLESLLKWSKTQTDDIKWNPEKIDIKDIADENIDLLISTAEKKNIHLKSEVKQDTYVFGDKNMIDTVIRNLTSNALKYTHSGGKILINASIFSCSDSAGNKFIKITVSDTGIGIREETRVKLFKIGVDLDTLETIGEKGTGLGLILCKEFVEKNKGQIWVESEAGMGSKFMFTIPVYSEVIY